MADAFSRAMNKSRTGEQVLHASVSQIRNLAKSVQEVNQVIVKNITDSASRSIIASHKLANEFKVA